MSRDALSSPADALRYRSNFIKFTRDFYCDAGYLEIDTPNLVIAPGTEIHLEYFKTEWHDYEEYTRKQLYLRSSPELHMKKALAELQASVFQISSAFRNKGEVSDWHYPEFKMLEAYKVDTSIEEYLAELERFIKRAGYLSSKSIIPHHAKFPILSVFEAFDEFAGIELIDRDPDLARKASAFPFISKADDFETAYFKVLLNVIEPKLRELGAAFLFGYPASQAALAQVNNGVAERFELYINGVEIANGFVELRGSDQNLTEIQKSNVERIALGKEEIPIDHNFIKSCNSIPERTIGVALGIDRLMALSAGLSAVHPVMPLYDFLA